jgi:hypothetical protein
MTRKIPDDAFALYWAMGHERSYRVLAEQLGVSKRAITDKANAENWAARMQVIEAEVKERVDAKIKDEAVESQLRHRKLLRAVESRAAQAITEHPLRSCLEGIRAAEIAIKMQRVIEGEPGERTEVVVAATTKAEIDRLLERTDEPSDPDGY